MENRPDLRLSFAKKTAVTVFAIASLGAPIAIGVMNSPFVHAQRPAAKPEFEVASVKPVSRKDVTGPGRVRYSPQGVSFSHVPLEWVIGEAFRVGYNRISSPDKRINDMFFLPTGTDYFFDIDAKANRPVPKDQIVLMLQTLLANRFSLVAHREPKMQPVYKLVAVKGGPKFREGEAGEDPKCSFGLEGFVCRNIEMSAFAALLSQYMDRPVLDSTGLTRSYNFTLKSEGGQAEGKSALLEWLSSLIFSDIEKQLGLRLEAGKGPVDFLIVDHVENPSKN